MGLRAAVEDLIQAAREHPDDDGVWTTVLWTAVDREDRAAGLGGSEGNEAERRE